MKKSRKRSHVIGTLQERLDAFARQHRAKAAKLPEGPERDALLSLAQQAEGAKFMDGALSPGTLASLIVEHGARR